MSALQQRVMRRVYAIWALRKISSPAFLRAYIAVALLLQVFSGVSIVSVIHNATYTSSKLAIIDFFARAFLHTNLIVQSLLVGLAILMVWFVRDMFASMQGMGFSMSKVGAGR